MPILQKRKDGVFMLIIPKHLIELRKWDKGKKLSVSNNERGNIEISEIK